MRNIERIPAPRKLRREDKSDRTRSSQSKARATMRKAERNRKTALRSL